MTKSLFILFISLLPCLAFAFAGGDGSSGNPYQVSTPAELNDVRNYRSSFFIQTADIDMDVAPYNTGEGFEPLAYDWAAFTGGYDGNSYTISNLFINFLTLFIYFNFLF